MIVKEKRAIIQVLNKKRINYFEKGTIYMLGYNDTELRKVTACTFRENESEEDIW